MCSWRYAFAGWRSKIVTTMDYVVVMIGLFFIVESLSDAFKSFGMRDFGDEKKMWEIEERVKILEGRIIKK